jgi:hypothetical protein
MSVGMGAPPVYWVRRKNGPQRSTLGVVTGDRMALEVAKS